MGLRQTVRDKVYEPVAKLGQLTIFAVCLSILAFLIAVVK